jgi:hypothetical protein
VVHQTADERVRQGGVDRFEGVLVRPFQQQAFIQLTRCESLKNRVGRKDPFVKCLWREAPSGYCQSQGTEDHALRIGRGFLETATEFCCESTTRARDVAFQGHGLALIDAWSSRRARNDDPLGIEADRGPLG